MVASSLQVLRERTRSILYAANMEGQRRVYGAREVGNCPADFQSCFVVQYFLTIPQLLSFGTVIYVLWHFILEVCNFLFYFSWL